MRAHTHTVILRYIAGLHASNKQTKNKKIASVQCLVHGGELNFPAVHSSKWVQKNPVIRWYLTGSFVAAPNESESLEVQMHWTSRWCIAPAVLAVVPSPICFFFVCSFCFLHEIPECSGVAEFLEEGGTDHGCQSTVDFIFSPFSLMSRSFPGEVRALEELM